MKRKLITGINFESGAYLVKILLNKGYQVHGIRRRSSIFNTQRIDHLIKEMVQNDFNIEKQNIKCTKKLKNAE